MKLSLCKPSLVCVAFTLAASTTHHAVGFNIRRFLVTRGQDASSDDEGFYSKKRTTPDVSRHNSRATSRWNSASTVCEAATPEGGDSDAESHLLKDVAQGDALQVQQANADLSVGNGHGERLADAVSKLAPTRGSADEQNTATEPRDAELEETSSGGVSLSRSSSSSCLTLSSSENGERGFEDLLSSEQDEDDVASYCSTSAETLATEEPCALCLETANEKPGEVWAKLPTCGHMFHLRCLGKVAEVSSIVEFAVHTYTSRARKVQRRNKFLQLVVEEKIMERKKQMKGEQGRGHAKDSVLGGRRSRIMSTEERDHCGSKFSGGSTSTAASRASKKKSKVEERQLELAYYIFLDHMQTVDTAKIEEWLDEFVPIGMTAKCPLCREEFSRWLIASWLLAVHPYPSNTMHRSFVQKLMDEARATPASARVQMDEARATPTSARVHNDEALRSVEIERQGDQSQTPSTATFPPPPPPATSSSTRARRRRHNHLARTRRMLIKQGAEKMADRLLKKYLGDRERRTVDDEIHSNMITKHYCQSPCRGRRRSRRTGTSSSSSSRHKESCGLLLKGTRARGAAASVSTSSKVRVVEEKGDGEDSSTSCRRKLKGTGEWRSIKLSRECRNPTQEDQKDESSEEASYSSRSLSPFYHASPTTSLHSEIRSCSRLMVHPQSGLQILVSKYEPFKAGMQPFLADQERLEWEQNASPVVKCALVCTRLTGGTLISTVMARMMGFGGRIGSSYS
ncbi:unnamed protein product [Amoebophrya sp. A25]|nr:unnamed protein product [Amoebophrya sp. A25]|eukprot:GSA25T00003745001.1